MMKFLEKNATKSRGELIQNYIIKCTMLREKSFFRNFQKSTNNKLYNKGIIMVLKIDGISVMMRTHEEEKGLFRENEI